MQPWNSSKKSSSTFKVIKSVLGMRVKEIDEEIAEKTERWMELDELT